jgi:hypothetical protein
VTVVLRGARRQQAWSCSLVVCLFGNLFQRSQKISQVCHDWCCLEEGGATLVHRGWEAASMEQ